MTNQEGKQLRDKIVNAIQISAIKMLEKKKQLGQKLVISENGVIKIIDAKDIK